MTAAKKSFFQLTAKDLMSRPVQAIPQEMPLTDAARLLAKARITGAPVVDGAGRCIGVLSASDFVHWAEQGGNTDPVRCTTPACSDWQLMELEFFPRDEARWHMTSDPVIVAPETPIIDVAKSLLDARIHRVIVVDAARKPVGVVSATDILAAVARAANLRRAKNNAVTEAATCSG